MPSGYKYIALDPRPKNGHKQGRVVQWADGELRWDTFNGVDLHRLLTDHSPNFALISVIGNYMRPSGILPKSIVVVDKTRKPKLGEVVAVNIDGCNIIRRVRKQNDKYFLVADDPSEKPYQINENTEVRIIGVVTSCINFINNFSPINN